MARLKILGSSRQRDTPAPAPDHVARLLESASDRDRRIVDAGMAHSMTGAPRLLALVDAVRYCVDRDIPGAFAECGVWRGGSVLAMILTLQDLGVEDRDVYLYDTFEGMTQPTEADVSADDPPALETWQRAQQENQPAWPHLFESDQITEEAVRSLMATTGYPAEKLHFVRGPVEDTIPGNVPQSIALLRLDTDWYESTRHELVHLFPRLRSGGVLIVDDYGHWQGARQAVDEYFSTEHPPLFFTRIDYAARIAVKQ